MKKSVCSVVMALAMVVGTNVFAQNLDMVKIPGKNFKMLKTEVTQGLYESVMEVNPSFFCVNSEAYENWNGEPYKLPEGWDQKKLPVENVSWYDAIYFCNKLSVKEGLEPVYSVNGTTDVSKWNYTPHMEEGIDSFMTIKQNLKASGYRLPTKEERGYASRGGQDFDYSGLADAAWYYDNSEEKTHPVAQKKANGYGLYDMIGNVYEWCWDNLLEMMPERYIDGGSYKGDYFDLCSGYMSFEIDPAGRSSDVGFRIVRTVK